MIISEFQKDSNPKVVAANLFTAIHNPVFPLDIEKIALNVGIQGIQEFDDKNLEGMLVADEDKAMGFISVGKHIRELTRRRFTISHELGHFLITTHKNLQNCTSSDLKIFSKDKNFMEYEANTFAANILMPEKEFLKIIQGNEPNRQHIQNLSEYFGSSLSSTLIRYITLSDEPMAIVMSEKSKIKWVSRSPSFKYYITSEEPLSEGTMAMEYFKGDETLYEFEQVEADLWFDTSDINHYLSLKEMAWPMPYYNSVISLLWLEEDEEEIENDNIEFDGYLKIKQ